MDNVFLYYVAGAFYSIKTSDLNGKKTLGDNDKIKMTVYKAACGSDRIEFSLATENKYMWRKSVRLEDGNGGYDSVLVESGDNRPAYHASIPSDLVNSYEIHLFKAKTGGNPWDMYRITDAASVFEGGYRYHFVWIQD